MANKEKLLDSSLLFSSSLSSLSSLHVRRRIQRTLHQSSLLWQYFCFAQAFDPEEREKERERESRRDCKAFSSSRLFPSFLSFYLFSSRSLSPPRAARLITPPPVPTPLSNPRRRSSRPRETRPSRPRTLTRPSPTSVSFLFFPPSLPPPFSTMQAITSSALLTTAAHPSPVPPSCFHGKSKALSRKEPGHVSF